MARKQPPRFNPTTFLEKVSERKATLTLPKNKILFSQGDAAHAVFYIHEGRIKLSTLSQEGKEAVIAILDRGNFLGEGCLAGQLVYMTTATALETSTLVRIEKQAMNDALRNEPAFSEQFLTYLLVRNIRIQEDLVDQLFNSSEKRLARVLLLMAHFGKEGKSEAIIPKISQEVLAEMIGTTRSRVSFFMNKFRKLGFLDYNGGVHVHSSLLSIVLHD
jgi:CRP/FNR family cyclic AMP-dependent transcriptional regulator